MEQALRRLADTYELTSLSNRAGFNWAFTTHLSVAMTENSELALLLIDLDGFKAVNDCCGHLVGDQVLQTIAAALHASYLAARVCAQLGGDKFAVLVPRVDSAGVLGLVETLLADLCHNVDIGDGTSLQVSGTIGISWLEPGLSERDLLRRADTGLYHGKRTERGTATCCSDAIDR